MDLLFQVLLFPIRSFVAVPWLALVPAIGILVWWLARARGTRASVPVAIATGLWLLYSVWEISFMFRPMREWIRVDLLLIAPVLLIATIWAFVSAVRHRHRSG